MVVDAAAVTVWANAVIKPVSVRLVLRLLTGLAGLKANRPQNGRKFHSSTSLSNSQKNSRDVELDYYNIFALMRQVGRTVCAQQWTEFYRD